MQIPVKGAQLVRCADILKIAKQCANVRELENLIERSLIVHRGEPLRFENLVFVPSNHVDANTGGTEMKRWNSMLAKRHIQGSIEQTNGRVHGPWGVGELLGMNPNTLR